MFPFSTCYACSFPAINQRNVLCVRLEYPFGYLEEVQPESNVKITHRAAYIELHRKG